MNWVSVYTVYRNVTNISFIHHEPPAAYVVLVHLQHFQISLCQMRDAAGAEKWMLQMIEQGIVMVRKVQ